MTAPLAGARLRLDEAARVRLGANAQTSEQTLLELASDPLIVVRVAVAMNSSAPPDVDEALATDPDERVRVLLARKIAAELPRLTGADQARLRRHAHAMLATLVEDEAIRVRAALSDVLKEMPEAPRDLILRLAWDSAELVSEPILRFSPLLAAEDLLALLASPPNEAAAVAIARRSPLSEKVSDAVAATADTRAVRALLANPSAQIRESTLDALVARAVLHTEWHEPLVRRPVLPARAARALSAFVATHLVEALAQRADLDPALAEELSCRVTAHLVVNKMPKATTTSSWLSPPDGQDEASAMAAARRGDARAATNILAAAAGVPVSVVERASNLRSAKGIISLVWKAGFNVRVTGPLQATLAELIPSAMLLPNSDGGFPLSPEEMQWQLDFLARPGR